MTELENISSGITSDNIKSILRNLEDPETGSSNSSDFFYPLQTHHSWEVAIQLEGESFIEYKYKKFVLRKGQVFIIEPNVPHRLGMKLTGSTGSKIMWVLATSDTIFPSLSTYQNGKRDKEWAIEITAPGSFLLHEIEEESRNHREFNNAALASYLSAFLMLVFRKLHFKEKVWENAKRTEMVITVKDYINKNITKSLTLEELAKLVSVSKNYLSTVFRTITGDTISQYILEVKSHMAIPYLIDSDKPLSQIAELVGFCDQFHFSKVFKSVIGIPPFEYRKTYGNNKANL